MCKKYTYGGSVRKTSYGYVYVTKYGTSKRISKKSLPKYRAMAKKRYTCTATPKRRVKRRSSGFFGFRL